DVGVAGLVAHDVGGDLVGLQVVRFGRGQRVALGHVRGVVDIRVRVDVHVKVHVRREVDVLCVAAVVGPVDDDVTIEVVVVVVVVVEPDVATVEQVTAHRDFTHGFDIAPDGDVGINGGGHIRRRNLRCRGTHRKCR